MSIENRVYDVHGRLRLYHKSFNDFLRDPTRSGAFCVNTPAIYCKYLDHLIQCHHHYASSYAIDGSSMYFLPLHLPSTYLLFQTLCRHQGSSAPLLHSLGHMELSLLTPVLSCGLFSASQPCYHVMNQTFVDSLRIFHSLYCNDWQMLIIASL